MGIAYKQTSIFCYKDYCQTIPKILWWNWEKLGWIVVSLDFSYELPSLACNFCKYRISWSIFCVLCFLSLSLALCLRQSTNIWGCTTIFQLQQAIYFYQCSPVDVSQTKQVKVWCCRWWIIAQLEVCHSTNQSLCYEEPIHWWKMRLLDQLYYYPNIEWFKYVPSKF